MRIFTYLEILLFCLSFGLSEQQSLKSYFSQELTRYTEILQEQISEITSQIVGDLPKQRGKSWKRFDSFDKNKESIKQNYIGDIPLTSQFKQQNDFHYRNEERILLLTQSQRQYFMNESLFQQPLTNPNCKNKGKSILVNQTQFYCNGTKLTWAQYNKTILIDANYKQNCQIIYRLKYACLCPRDFSGTQCQIWNPIICDIQKVPLVECPQFNSKYYQSQLDGDPPCQQVSSQSIVTELIEVICFNYNQSIIGSEKVQYDEPFEIIWSNYTEGIFRLQPKYYSQYYLEAVLNASNFQNSTNQMNFSSPPNQTNPTQVRVLLSINPITIPQVITNDTTSSQQLNSTDDIIDNTIDVSTNSTSDNSSNSTEQILMATENLTYFFTPITYKYNESTFVSTFNIEISPIIYYPNWKNILQSVEVQSVYALSINELLTISPTAIQHQFDTLYLQGISMYGRFYYMTNLKLVFPDSDPTKTIGNIFICSQNAVTGYYEDMFYEEPAYNKKFAKSFMVGLIVLFCAIVIISISIVFYYKKRTYQRNLQSQLELEKNKILLKMENNKD